MTLKYSKQREAIKEFMLTRRDHPTADVVYMNVRREFPRISLGTVYRNLTLLSERGELLKLRVGDGVDHFDALTSPHYHFVCTTCGTVQDLQLPVMDSLTAAANRECPGRIEGHVTYFYGKCGECCPK